PQALQTDRFEIARQSWMQLTGRHGLLGDNLLEYVEWGVCLERWPRGQQFVEDRPQGIDVGGRTYLLLLASGLLRRHVARRTENPPAGGLPSAGVHLPSET